MNHGAYYTEPDSCQSQRSRVWRLVWRNMEFVDLIQEAAKRQLSLADIALYCELFAVSTAQRLENCAIELARGYAAGSVSYEAADNLANVLFAYAAQNVAIPAVLFSVFQAFDAGEFYPDEIRSPSPEERFTRPQINAILKDYDNGNHLPACSTSGEQKL